MMAEAFRVRVAAPDDAEPIGTLLRASYPSLMLPGYSAAVLARALPLMVRATPALLRSGTYYLVEGPGRALAGCGGWRAAGRAGADQERREGRVRGFGPSRWAGRFTGPARRGQKMLTPAMAKKRARAISATSVFWDMGSSPPPS